MYKFLRKSLILLVVVFIGGKSFAQYNLIEIDYLFVMATPKGEIFNYYKTLKDDGTNSIYIDKDTITTTNKLVKKPSTPNLGLFYNKIEDRIHMYAPIFYKDYYINEDSMSSRFIWKIDESKRKVILGYSCKMATCEFRGRSYVVYFTDEIPFYTGPWKLVGLPGTILEATTVDGLYKFQAMKLQMLSNAQKLKNPYSVKNFPYLTFTEHKKLFLKKMIDLQRKVQSEEKDEDVSYSIDDTSIELLK